MSMLNLPGYIISCDPTNEVPFWSVEAIYLADGPPRIRVLSPGEPHRQEFTAPRAEGPRLEGPRVPQRQETVAKANRFWSAFRVPLTPGWHWRPRLVPDTGGKLREFWESHSQAWSSLTLGLALARCKGNTDMCKVFFWIHSPEQSRPYKYLTLGANAKYFYHVVALICVLTTSFFCGSTISLTLGIIRDFIIYHSGVKYISM